MSVVKYNCLKCGGELDFKPKLQKWECRFCRSIFEEKDLIKDEIKYDKTNAEEHVELNVYKCNSCGAELVCDDNTIVTRCTYCRNNTIIKDKLVGKYEPKLIIPFKNTTDEVKSEFKKQLKKHHLLPNDFLKITNYNIVGIYVPFWLYDAYIDGEVKFNASDSETHRSGDYIVTKTKHYLVTRGGNATFKRIPHDGSIRMDDALMNSVEPYDYNEIVPFKAGFLAGFQAEKYDQNEDEMFTQAGDRAHNSTIEEFKKTCKYDTVTVKEDKLNNKKVQGEYALLPVWIFDINFKNQIYQFTMNGQTGKLVGNFPISKLKVLLRCLLIVLIPLVVICLFIGLVVWG